MHSGSNETVTASGNASFNENNHSHRSSSQSKLLLVFFLTTIFMVIELIAGFLANSLALIADAGHMLNDIMALLLAIIALRLSAMKSNSKFTFGYKRVEVLSGLINGLSLIFIAGYIIKEAFQRIMNRSNEFVEGDTVIIIASIGLFINLIGLRILNEEKSNSINIEGAYHHLLADLLGSVAAVIAGVGILIFETYWLDTVASVLVSIFIWNSGLSITKKSVKILIQATPEGVDLDVLKSELKTIYGVVDIHDFHAWTVTDGFNLVTAHLIVKSFELSELITTAAASVSKNYGFNHSTFQIEQQYCTDINDNC